jgi:hypothetical protein
MGTTSTMAPKQRPNPARDRVELRADPEWIEKVLAASDRVGLSISAYIRLAVNRLMETPDFSPPVETCEPEKPARRRRKE